ncbi:MAG TPA: bifunctional 4-hydroxy-2-oxoglutarate aldolase/2-dehydro-3-deoxy-phosphogluconate aldolase [Woeseiaceae bacterium]|nr:bifunctional 4-hydroxy-2-oxoglutarate aldolase/2-dehydro-3-deoxy-phosphogluconate aldolase [Woeseiaceae bacterium]
MKLEGRLEQTPVVPLVQAEDPGIAVRTGEALIAGGLTVIEVVMRTDAALRCLEAVARSVPGAIVGAGTVLSEAQARAAADAGARFIVSPGLEEAVVNAARSRDLPAFPGIATATELQRGWNLGLRTVKFFPAGVAGGPAMIKALGAAFRDMRFMPTGGVSAANLADYLALPQVLACGGSWLTPAAAIAEGDYEKITALAAQAVEIAGSARSNVQHG